MDAEGASTHLTFLSTDIEASTRGIDCVQCPMPRRREAGTRLARDLPANALAPIGSVEPLANVPKLAGAIVAGQVRGRVAIDVNA
jgi:acrylyl-CoA reductase (NADPH)